MLIWLVWVLLEVGRPSFGAELICQVRLRAEHRWEEEGREEFVRLAWDCQSCIGLLVDVLGRSQGLHLGCVISPTERQMIANP